MTVSAWIERCAPTRERVTQKRQWSQFCRCSLNQGLATVTLKIGNTVTMEQLQRAITKNGFTTKQSNVVVTGHCSRTMAK